MQEKDVQNDQIKMTIFFFLKSSSIRLPCPGSHSDYDFLFFTLHQQNTTKTSVTDLMYM